jgi:hypothetical protein
MYHVFVVIFCCTLHIIYVVTFKQPWESSCVWRLQIVLEPSCCLLQDDNRIPKGNVGIGFLKTSKQNKTTWYMGQPWPKGCPTNL